MENKELNTNDLEQVSGGSIFNRESSIRDAGIELRYEDGTPGSFGIFYNSGDYYFQLPGNNPGLFCGPACRCVHPQSSRHCH